MATRRYIIPLAAALLVAAGCGSEGRPALPQGGEEVALDPAEFTADVDHPYWPMRPGSRWVYVDRSGGAEQRVDVRVTNRTRVVDGVAARVVRDVVTENGALVEDTFDWYAQDAAGNVWYLGEATKEYDDGKVVTTAGSWEAGVGGAQAGILLPAVPEIGQAYRQEYAKGEAEDAAEVLSLDERVQVPAGDYDGVLMTKDFTPLEPDVLEHKFYARGVGPVLTLGISGGGGREELVEYTR
jgi:hypothetical protein